MHRGAHRAPEAVRSRADPHQTSVGEPRVPGSVTRVLVVEDLDLMADLLVYALEKVGFEVRAAGLLTVEAVMAEVGEFRPDVVLLDLFLGPETDSIAMIGPLVSAGVQVLMLTGAHGHHLLADCLEAGAGGLFYKDQGLDSLVEFVHDAAVGVTVMQPAGRDALIESLRDGDRRDTAWSLPFASLSPREQQVLSGLMQGYSADDIAVRQFVSIATIRAQIRSVLHKLGVNSQLAAVVLAQQAAWRPADDS